jgi:2-dehydropantoate 2-reductase
MSSTLQSLKRGRPVEIDYLKGEIVRIGQKTGTPAPYNAKIVELVKEVERTHQFFSPEELAQRFAGLRPAAR